MGTGGASVRHVVMFSGGLGSWATATRVAERHGAADLTLLFADTLMEDEDLYRFIEASAANIGGNLVRIAEGRDPWQVFHDVRYLGNTRIDPCSRLLKREFLRRYLEANFDVADTTVYLGIDWTEAHRFKAAKPRWAPWRVEAPLCEKPYRMKQEFIRDLADAGIEVPRLYQLGHQHNNCGGFCVKQGQAGFANLLRTMPERYRYHEQKEQEMGEFLGKKVTILRDRSGGVTKPISLREFRERLEGGGQYDIFEWGGCNCVA
jgi:hypothetical protein